MALFSEGVKAAISEDFVHQALAAWACFVARMRHLEDSSTLLCEPFQRGMQCLVETGHHVKPSRHPCFVSRFFCQPMALIPDSQHPSARDPTAEFCCMISARQVMEFEGTPFHNYHLHPKVRSRFQISHNYALFGGLSWDGVGI